jgi:hypothetical protein
VDEFRHADAWRRIGWMKARRVDLNSILQFANLAVTAAVIHVLVRLQSEPHEFMDWQSAGLGLLLALQTQLALIVERRRRDPFVLLLCFGTILYFSLRLFTLYLYPVSAVFERFHFDAADMNYALVFILVANLFLYAGLFSIRLKPDDHVEAGERRATSPILVLGLLASTVMITYLGSREPNGTPRAIAALAVLLSPLMIVTMALTYWLLFRRTLSAAFKFSLAALIIIEMIAHTLWGSRSAVVGFVQMFLLVSFGVFGVVTFSRRLVTWGVLAAPLIVVLLVGMFAVSTFMRVNKDSGMAFDFGSAISNIDDAVSETLGGPAAEAVIGSVFARAGFLDFSAEVIANREEYSTVINLPAYARSFVDNVATPGFDLFDQPKIANSLLFVYRGWGAPSKRGVDTLGGYQSDQIGLYGELYVLFGYGSLPVFFLIGWGLKRIYASMRDNNPYLLAMKRVIVLSFFVRTIDSFGFDWTVGEVLPIVVATFLYSMLFASRRPPTSIPPVAAAVPQP